MYSDVLSISKANIPTNLLLPELLWCIARLILLIY